MSLRSQHQIQKKFNKFLRRALQLVLSVSLFPLFVWYSSGFSILPQSFIAYFSTCLFSMLTHTLERKYMFLIFNGILAFLAKTSLSTSSPPISALDIEFQASNLSETKEPVSPESVPLMVEEQVEKQQEYYEQVSELAEKGEDGSLLLLTDTKGREYEASIADDVVEEEEDDEEGGVGGTRIGVTLTQDGDDDELAGTTVATNEELANTDELNRKFEEFIRKMKEEIRIEAQTHPIAV